ncbi:MAG: hypothetical protein A3A33_01205 [Candidatus Yanofskybacteria bacterium RIFCSPLOWO2_01_FULL_49_25]|uniref:Carbohydrate-binding module family 96 domain-containing protein n=1 Tax=Candidatus Yanofskybacteria bacterium RIFCSPLOWO2_01_FULL_49_25 TaxID=1802701 RepID=A0A1F8GX01_9BACT|nr:MAG: hypothetical protein A3A33_01205 [Candidatus Yanofskybacteria bacterium RIFCSPLOWO2_01_FULL_49_25]
MKLDRTRIFDIARLIVVVALSMYLLSLVPMLPADTYVVHKKNPEIISYHPSPDRIKDMFYSSVFDYGSGHIIDNQKLRVGGWGDEYWTLIQFDLSGLPKHADEVTLFLTLYDEEGTSTGMDISAITTPWDETHGWYINLGSESLTSVDAPPRSGFFSLDITDLYNRWQSGEQKNYGLVFKPTGTDHQFNTFRSSEYSGDRFATPFLNIKVK